MSDPDVSPLVNLFDSVRDNPRVAHLSVGDLLCAEYTCPIDRKTLGIWSEHDYLVHVVSGRKTWHIDGIPWEAKGGDSIYFKRGVAVVEQFFDADFCLLICSIPNDLIAEVVRELSGAAATSGVASEGTPAFRLSADVGLTAYLQSMLHYFSGEERPSDALLRLKVRELATSLYAGSCHPALPQYFQSLSTDREASLRCVMEENFRHRLALDDFARLCHRSLSSFKRDFTKVFAESPGRWLLKRRLQYAQGLLRQTKQSVTQIALESGFEDVSHFSKAFRSHFNMAPSDSRTGVHPVD